MKTHKRNLLKRSLSLFLVLVMCLGLLQTTAFAEGEADESNNETMVLDIDLGSSQENSEESSGIPDEDPSALGEDSNIPEEESSTLDDDSAIPEEGSNPSNENSGAPADAEPAEDNGSSEEDSEENGIQTLEIDLEVADGEDNTETPEDADSVDGTEDDEQLQPGEVKKDESLDEMTKVPDGYVEGEDGSFNKTESTESEVKDTNRSHTIKNETNYEWKKVPVSDESGRLVGYTTITYATSTTTETIENAYSATPVQNGLNNLDRQLAQQRGFSNVSHNVEEWDETGKKALVYTRTGEKIDPETGAKIVILQRFDTHAGSKTETIITSYDQKKISEKTISITQNEDGTITYQPGIKDETVDHLTSLTPDIETDSVQMNPDKTNHLYRPSGQTVALVNPDYIYQWTGEYGPHSAVPINLANFGDLDTSVDKNSNPVGMTYAGLLLLMDKEGNAHYVYCADIATPQIVGTQYTIENLEDAVKELDKITGEVTGYIPSQEDIEKIQAIALNGYWGKEGNGIGSLNYVKGLLGEIEDINPDLLTPGIALAATQAAIWYYTNGDQGINKEDPFNSKYTGTLQIGLNSERFTAEQEAVAMALYNYLINHAVLTEEQKVTTDIIKESDIKDTTITVRDLAKEPAVDAAAVYNADVSFVLEVEPARMNSDDLQVTLYDALTGEAIGTFRLAGEDGNGQEGYAKYVPNEDGRVGGTYILENVQLSNGSTVTLKLTGTQTVKQNAYLITASTGYDKSQTFVGIEEGTRDVSLALNVHFSIEDVVVEEEDPEPDPEPTPDPRPTPDPEPTPEPEPIPTPNPTPSGSGSSTPAPAPSTPAPEAPVEVADEVTPLAETPEETVPAPEQPAEAEIADEETPLAEIPDEVVPLSDIPRTGDISLIWGILAAISCMGLIWLFLEDKKCKNTVQ